MNKQVVINNQLVSYNFFGVVNADKSVLFLHGWRSQKEVWSGVVEQLVSKSVDKQISLYAIDFPGFGSSQKPQTDFGVGDYAEIVKGFIEKLELKNVIIVGHSFGGRVGIKLAAKNSVLVKKLVLVDSAGFAMEAKKKNTYGLFAKIVKPFFKPRFMQGLRAKIYKAIGAEDYLATPELQKIYVKVINEDLSGDMTNITCPTLILNGESDLDTPVEFAKRMHALIHDSQLEIISNAGHFSFIDNSEDFFKHLKNFIN